MCWISAWYIIVFSRRGKGCTGRSKYEEYGIGEEQEETERFQINQKGIVSIGKGKEAGRREMEGEGEEYMNRKQQEAEKKDEVLVMLWGQQQIGW